MADFVLWIFGLQTFVKTVNYQHIMPTRYTLDMDLKGAVPTDATETSEKRKVARQVCAMTCYLPLCPVQMPMSSASGCRQEQPMLTIQRAGLVARKLLYVVGLAAVTLYTHTLLSLSGQAQCHVSIMVDGIGPAFACLRSNCFCAGHEAALRGEVQVGQEQVVFHEATVLGRVAEWAGWQCHVGERL